VVSLASAAAEFLADDVDLASETALVVGAGDIATAAADALAGRDVDPLVVANRTVPNAEGVAASVDAPAEGVGLDDLSDAIERARVAVSATGSCDPVVDVDLLEGGGETAIVDMAQPRDVAPAAGTLPAVEVYDLDDLEEIADATRERLREAADRAAEIIDEEFERLLEQYKRKRADEVIAAMYESAGRVKTRELETAIDKLEARGDLTEGQREAVQSMADALVGQLLAAPTKSLREAAAEDDWTTISTALQLFDPEFEPEGPPGGAGEDAAGHGEGTSGPRSSAAPDER